VISYWDPIGVADEPEATGEYDGYLETIRQELVAGDAESLASRLHAISTDRMGLSRSLADELRSARALFAWHVGASE
jgi:hypothetical protein